MLAEKACEAEFPPRDVDGNVEAAELQKTGDDQNAAEKLQERAGLPEDGICVHVQVRFRMMGVFVPARTAQNCLCAGLANGLRSKPPWTKTDAAVRVFEMKKSATLGAISR